MEVSEGLLEEEALGKGRPQKPTTPLKGNRLRRAYGKWR